MTDLVNDDNTRRQIQALAAIFCSQEEAVGVLGTSSPKLAAFLKANPDAEDAWNRGKMTGRVSLRRKQYALADRNVGMAIWMGKQFFGQTDDPESLRKKELSEPDPDLRRAASNLSAEDKRQLERLLTKAAGNDSSAPAGDDAGADSEGVGARESA